MLISKKSCSSEAHLPNKLSDKLFRLKKIAKIDLNSIPIKYNQMPSVASVIITTENED